MAPGVWSPTHRCTMAKTCFLLSVWFCHCSHAETDLFALSLEELLQIKVENVGILTRVSSAEQPTAVTVISANDIAVSSARNLYDLFEIFLPGAYWMQDDNGPVLGLRGSLLSRNYKYLLMVNNRVINSKGRYGALTELEQWDLADIESVSVIRGPGSVTHGPGAVAGVINIVTFSATSERQNGEAQNRFSNNMAALRYVNRYDAKGLTWRNHKEFETLKLFTFFSFTDTEGYHAPQYLVDDVTEYGYVGKDAFNDEIPLPYFADFKGQPQIKLHVDADFSENWRAWFRYTQQGSHWQSNETQTDFDGILVSQQGVQAKQFIATVEHKKNLDEALTITTLVSVDSLDSENRTANDRAPNPDDVLNFRSNYAEHELLLLSKLNWQISAQTEFAIGVEFSHDRYGPGWGDTTNDMRLGDNRNIINGPTSNALEPGNNGSADADGDPIYVGNGWSENTWALYSEYNAALGKGWRTILSARVDNGTYSETLISPRFSLIKKINNQHHLAFTAQQSSRRNTAEQRYVENRYNMDTDPEVLTAVELGWRFTPVENTLIKMSAYRNSLDIISWDGDLDESLLTGKLSLYGLEMEVEQKFQHARLGANFSWTKMDEWMLRPDLLKSEISYSDYNQPIGDYDAVITGTGNNLNNWPDYALKFFATWQATEKLGLHVNLRYFSKLQGAKDGLNALENAVEGSPDAMTTNQIVEDLDRLHVYDADLRLNTSVNYAFSQNLQTRLFINNLYSKNNKRYAIDSGNDDVVPKRVRFREEPLAVGLRFEYLFD